MPHLVSGDATPCLLRDPGIQGTGAVPKQPVLGKVAGVHGFPMQQVHTLDSGASPWQKCRRQQLGCEGPQLLIDHVGFQGEVAAQGGIAPAHHHPLIQPAHGLCLRQ